MVLLEHPDKFWRVLDDFLIVPQCSGFTPYFCIHGWHELSNPANVSEIRLFNKGFRSFVGFPAS